MSSIVKGSTFGLIKNSANAHTNFAKAYLIYHNSTYSSLNSVYIIVIRH